MKGCSEPAYESVQWPCPGPADVSSESPSAHVDASTTPERSRVWAARALPPGRGRLAVPGATSGPPARVTLPGVGRSVCLAAQPVRCTWYACGGWQLPESENPATAAYAQEVSDAGSPHLDHRVRQGAGATPGGPALRSCHLRTPKPLW